MCVVLPSNPYKRMISLLSSPWIPSGLLSLSLPWFLSLPGRERESRDSIWTHESTWRRDTTSFSREEEEAEEPVWRATKCCVRRMSEEDDEEGKEGRRRRRGCSFFIPLPGSCLFPWLFFSLREKSVCSCIPCVRVMQDKSCEVSQWKSLPSFFPTSREKNRETRRRAWTALVLGEPVPSFLWQEKVYFLQEWGEGKNMKDYRVRRREKHKRTRHHQRIEWQGVKKQQWLWQQKNQHFKDERREQNREKPGKRKVKYPYRVYKGKEQEK